MTVRRRDVVMGLPIVTATLPHAARAASFVQPQLQNPAFGSTGKIVTFGPSQNNKTLTAALMAASAGDVVQYPATEPRGQVFRESVGVPDRVTLDLGGVVTDGGTAAPAWRAGAIIDGTEIENPTGYVQQMGGVVALGHLLLKGGEIRGFGLGSTTADGTAGVRAAGTTIGHIYIDNCYIHDNQNGIGPGGTMTAITITNTWLEDNELDPTGQSHNIYATNTVTILTVGPGVTSTQASLHRSGGGHAVKSRATKFTQIIGPCYLYSGDASCLDIPDGSAAPCQIGPSVTFVKKSSDINHTVFAYCAESKTNGSSGVQCTGVNIVANCPAPNILNNGRVSFDFTCKFIGNSLVMTQPSLATGLPRK